MAVDVERRRVAALEEQVAYFEAALLRLREEVRMGDALTARSLGALVRQIGATFDPRSLDDLDGPNGVGPLAKVARRFRVAFEAGGASAPGSATPSPTTEGLTTTGGAL